MDCNCNFNLSMTSTLTATLSKLISVLSVVRKLPKKIVVMCCLLMPELTEHSLLDGETSFSCSDSSEFGLFGSSK